VEPNRALVLCTREESRGGDWKYQVKYYVTGLQQRTPFGKEVMSYSLANISSNLESLISTYNCLLVWLMVGILLSEVSCMCITFN